MKIKKDTWGQSKISGEILTLTPVARFRGQSKKFEEFLL